MSDKIFLKDITLPIIETGENETYSFVQTDSDLETAGDAADAKKTGDEITQLKADLTDLQSVYKKVAIGDGYAINTSGQEYTELQVEGNVFQGALLRKCKKNLFDASFFGTKGNYIANPDKSYQPYLPIFVKPSTSYKVTFTVTDRETYNATSWSDRQWISNDPTTLAGITSAEFASVDTKTINLMSSAAGCLYFVNIWGNQGMLDKFFACFTVMIVEAGIYEDYATFAAYDGVDVPLSSAVDAQGYENFVIHRSVNDADLRNALPSAVINWYYSENVEGQINDAIAIARKQAEVISAQNKIVPLFVDTIADYNWVSKYEVTAFSSNDAQYADGTTDGNNGYFAVSGNEGDNYVTLISGGNADLSVLTSYDKSHWLSGVLVDDSGAASPCNFFYKSETELYIYPSLVGDITSGQLGNIQTGIHLSKRGYKGYAQHIWSINPKHCEKSKYIKKYRVGDIAPFTIYGGNVGVRNEARNVPDQYQSKYGSNTFVLNMDWGSAQFHNTETGIEWTADIAGYTGYFEAYVGDSGVGVSSASIDQQGSSYNFEYPSGAEIHCELYVDGVLVDSYVKKSKRLERVCLDFANGAKAKIKIYSSKWQETNHGFSLGSMTWWVNERWTDANENPYLFKAITQLFDSWGDFQSQEVQNELEALHQDEIGTPVPINNKSARNMTSQWGRLWFYENVQECNATVMITDFGINDCNSASTPFPDEIAPDGSAWPVSFTPSSYAESMRKLIAMATKNNVLPIVMSLGWRGGSGNGTYTWIQSAIDAQAESV